MSDIPFELKALGFTGTREGMTSYQKRKLRDVVQFALASFDQVSFHHGDCVGADEEAHNIVRDIGGIQIFVYPPIATKYRAYCSGYAQAFAPEAYLTRNKQIVARTSLLIAAPAGPEIIRSGTWSTVRYARSLRKDVCILNREEPT